MKGMLLKLAQKFLKGRWGAILPAVLKVVAEGGFGGPLKKLYWATAKYKTTIGAILWGAGAALETVCGNYPEFSWACTYSAWPYWLGMVLTGVGLADGGTRAPWPTAPNGRAPWEGK